MRIAPLLVLALAPCAAPYSFDEGTVCLADPDAPASFQAGDDLDITVILDPCMGCAKEFDARCGYRVEGDTITLDASGWWKEDQTRACAAVCLELSATCHITGLDPGTYRIISGSHELTVTLPSADPVAQDDACQ